MFTASKQEIYLFEKYLLILLSDLDSSAERKTMLPDRSEYPPVYIQSFGGLRIFLGEAELVFPKKPPYRLLSMIKLMIASGGTKVPVNGMCDALWETADGDAAINKFYTSVHRLRKMLGSNSILQAKNLISFNRECVDLDIWRLQRLCEGEVPSKEDLTVFGRPWLPEDDSAWLESPRQHYLKRVNALLKTVVN